ncbi:hypothetical protein ACFSSC_08310 [Corynebacterium mendelii]|uniref:Uncharacterized protein n=1 Tax=Corynebacterium mendelii TaxID=2765362 RepID=A0A939E0G3_9CORY|nr:hypothetical protein [Corynebacterium mendelii]MBN9644664.1 hypothetical protein [Corynebacterium mendelii]
MVAVMVGTLLRTTYGKNADKVERCIEALLMIFVLGAASAPDKRSLWILAAVSILAQVRQIVG